MAIKKLLIGLCYLCSLTAIAQTGFLRGGDLSMVTYQEDWGTVFKYQDGNSGDVFDILQSYGINFARLRLYNAPGTAVNDGGYTYRTPIKSKKYPNGYPYAGPEDILHLAKRAKAHDMAICLTFNLSDYWSNAGLQCIPTEWASATTYEALKTAVSTFVTEFMQEMVNQGTTPEYVSVGNETNWGILFQTIDGTKVTYGGSGEQMSQFAGLFNAAYDAIKAVSPTTQVIFHHSMGHDGGISACEYLFDLLITTHKMQVDVIGGSYYPYWASQQASKDNTPQGMLKWAAAIETKYHKPIMIMETGYSWTRYRPYDKNKGNYEGQLHLNGSYNEASEAGQEAFMHQLHSALESDNNILGYMYWDPVFVDQKVNGAWTEVCWAEKYDSEYKTWWQDGNVISNTTLFNYTGYPLSALYREIASYTTEITTPAANESNHAPRKVLQGNQILIHRFNKTYTLTGQEIVTADH